jgi:hypothetical protein
MEASRLGRERYPVPGRNPVLVNTWQVSRPEVVILKEFRPNPKNEDPDRPNKMQHFAVLGAKRVPASLYDFKHIMGL